MIDEKKEPDDMNVTDAFFATCMIFLSLFMIIILIFIGIIYFNLLTLPIVIFGCIFFFILFMLFVNFKLKFQITYETFKIFVRKQQIFSIRWKYIQNIEIFKEELVFKPFINSIGRSIEGYVINFYTQEYKRTIKLYCWNLGKLPSSLRGGGYMPYFLNMKKQLEIINTIKNFANFFEISIKIDETNRKREIKHIPCNEFMYLTKGFNR